MHNTTILKLPHCTVKLVLQQSRPQWLKWSARSGGLSPPPRAPSL